MSVVISHHVQVMSPWTSRGVMLEGTMLLGEQLFKAIATDHRIFRLIVGSARNLVNVKFYKNIKNTLDAIGAARAAKRIELCSALLEDDHDGREFDVDTLVVKKMREKVEHLLPKVWTVIVNIGDMQGQHVNVLGARNTMRYGWSSRLPLCIPSRCCRWIDRC